MKKLASLLAAALIMAAGTASAFPVLTLQADSGTPITVTDEQLASGPSTASDLYLGKPGVVTFAGTVGSWGINVSTGLSGVGGTGIPELDLNSVDCNSSGPSKLVITLSDTMTRAGAGPGAVASVGGTFNASGFSSAIFETLINGQSVSKMTFSGGTSTAFSSSDAFSFTPKLNDEVKLIATLIQSGAGSTSFDYALAPVPEPGTMMLLGAGFFGLAIYGKRRKNA